MALGEGVVVCASGCITKGQPVSTPTFVFSPRGPYFLNPKLSECFYILLTCRIR